MELHYLHVVSGFQSATSQISRIVIELRSAQEIVERFLSKFCRRQITKYLRVTVELW